MSPYNLLEEPWIPVRCASGAVRWITPSDIVVQEDPPVAVASPRPDFDGALTQFLIGLLQTTAAPKTTRDWRGWFSTPPTRDTLAQQFHAVHVAFELDGEGPRFMQDLELRAQDGVRLDVASLLIEAPGAQTLERNTDLFIKRGRVQALGMPMLAAALFTLHTNAPSGGQGHRTSLRGGGPLTTLVQGETLWRTIWLNVLLEEAFLQHGGDPTRRDLESSFPWLAPTCTSEGGRVTTPDHVHPAQQFWAMPRRIRVDFGSASDGRCDLTGHQGLVVTQYWAKNLGINYKGSFLHPLTAHRFATPGDARPLKTRAEGLPYRDWPQLALGRGAMEETGVVPARVVMAYYAERRAEQDTQHRLWAFGFEMDNMKARCFQSATTPLMAFDLDGRLRQAFRDSVEACVAASEQVRKTTVQKIKEALLRRPSDRTGDLTHISKAFWTSTEPAFFTTLQRIADALRTDSDDTDAREQWLTSLHEGAIALFRDHSQERGDFAAADVERVARAWNDVHKRTSPRSHSLRRILNLPVKSSPSASSHA